MTVTLNCAYCGGALASGDRFCAQCGAELLACGNCGESLLPGDESCPECGTPVDPGEPSQFQLYPSPESPPVTTDLIERLQRATLGEFEIGQELGRGGMAAVFLAHDVALDRKVAIKVMSPGLLLGDGMIDRFRNEAVTIANLHHPNIVSLYSVRHAEGLHFFVMRYVRGCPLDQLIQKAGRLPLPIVRSILFQVGSALAYAHRSRVIHRDIKPANILIDQEGNAVVTDFGIAKAAESPNLTLTGALVGTPAYMSPEQCSGIGVSWASDQYALGAVAYEMLTGVPPFTGSTLTVMQAHVERTPRPIREHFPDCPAELEAAVFQMLAKNPADRWARMSEALAALGAAPLAEDDPLRIELSRLATPENASAPPSTPASPTPATRPSPAPQHDTGVPVGAIAILPPPAGLEVGDSFVLVAMVRGQHGTRLPPTEVTWSSDNSEVLRFESGGGVAVAIAAGTTVLAASCRGVEAQLRVEVASPRADEIVIGAVDRLVGVGEEIRLEATTHDKRGRPIARPVGWQSDASETATVSSDGTLVALSPGFARITALLDDARASIVIPILPARAAAIHLRDWPVSVAEGRSFTVTATPVDRWDNALAGRSVTWRSSNEDVATVSDTGRVDTKGPGSVVLTAICEDISASIRVNVGAAPERDASVGLASRRRRNRRRRTIVMAAAAGAALTAGVIWLLERAPLSSLSFDSRARDSAGAPEPPGYAESNFDGESVVPPSEPATVAEPSQPARAVGKPPRSVSRTPHRSAIERDTTPARQPASSPNGQAPANAELVDRVSPPPQSSTSLPPAAEPVAVNPSSPASAARTQPAPSPAPDARQVEALLRSASNECYTAVRAKNVTRLTQMYHPATKADEDKLKKLSRILRTREWAAEVGERVDGARRIGPRSAAMEFSVRLSWKDAFGGRLNSEPVFRTELARQGDEWKMSSCRVVGSPRL